MTLTQMKGWTHRCGPPIRVGRLQHLAIQPKDCCPNFLKLAWKICAWQCLLCVEKRYWVFLFLEKKSQIRTHFNSQSHSSHSRNVSKQ